MNLPVLDNAISELRSSLGDAKPVARLAAVEALLAADRNLFAPLAVPILAGLVSDQDSVVSVGAIRNLGLLGSMAAAAIPELTAALRGNDDDKIRASLSTLRAIGPAAQAAGSSIFQVVKHGRAKLPLVAAQALQTAYELLHVDISEIISHNDFESFLQQYTASSRLTDIPDPDAPERPKFLADILSKGSQPGGYLELAKALEESSHAFRSELASKLEPALNTHIQSIPHDTYDEKKTLAKWVNDELRRFDLAIKCPKTGKPALLVGDPGNHPEIGRFCIEIKGDDGKRKRTVQTPELPQLSLMEAAPRREALAEWHGKVRRQGDNTGRA